MQNYELLRQKYRDKSLKDLGTGQVCRQHIKSTMYTITYDKLYFIKIKRIILGNDS